MENVYNASKTIILFLIIMLVIQSFFGDKAAQKMSMIILFSMLILQADKFASYTKAIVTNLTNTGTTTTHESESGREHGGAGKGF